jgi:hypothetical protein
VGDEDAEGVFRCTRTVQTHQALRSGLELQESQATRQLLEEDADNSAELHINKSKEK